MEKREGRKLEELRKPLQGVINIIRFNWHYYLFAIGLVLLMYMGNTFLNHPYKLYVNILLLAIIFSVFSSLVISAYVYDISGFYKLNWLDEIKLPEDGKMVNIHAGFDEISGMLQYKFPKAELIIYDFYDPIKHTEVSIKRARQAYQIAKGTKQVSTTNLPLKNGEADTVFAIFAAHEIRNEAERNIFFTELKRIVKPNGKIILVEHLRDLPNLLAYNIGFLHFVSKASWYRTFNKVDLRVSKVLKHTPFVSILVLQHGKPS